MFATPLHTVHCKGTLEDVEQMKIQLEVDPILLEALQLETAAIPSQSYALHEASRLAHNNCVRFLLKAGARPDIFDCEIYTAILHAMSDVPTVTKDESTIVKTVSVLLEGGAKPDYVHPLKPRTHYLQLAYEKKHYDLIKLFLEHGATTEECTITEKGEFKALPSKDKEPLLWIAVKKRDYKLFSMLLLHGAKLKLVDEDGDEIPLDHFMFMAFIGKKPERFIEMYKLYYEHGGTLWTEIRGDTILDMFPDNPTEDSDEDSDNDSEDSFFFKGKSGEVKASVKNLICNPRTLQSSCRLVIKKTMGRKYATAVHELPLPAPTISYLLFSDCERLTTEEDDSTSDSEDEDDEDEDFSDISSGSLDSEDFFDMLRTMSGGYDSDDSDGKDMFYYMRLDRQYNPDMFDF